MPTDKFGELLPDSHAMNDLAQNRRLRAQFEAVASIDSTQTALLARPISDLPHGHTLIAGHQTAGRGRLTRSWQDPEGQALLMSSVVHIHEGDHHFEVLPLVTGLAVQRALHTVLSGVRLKWPNDIVTHDGLKLGGLLSVARENAILIGIGLNTSLTSEELPTPVATSLELLGHHVARENLIAEIVAQVHSAIADANWVESYNQASATLGKHVRLHRKDQPTIEGTVVEFAVDGSIRIATELGDEAFSIGDIEHLRVSE